MHPYGSSRKIVLEIERPTAGWLGRGHGRLITVSDRRTLGADEGRLHAGGRQPVRPARLRGSSCPQGPRIPHHVRRMARLMLVCRRRRRPAKRVRHRHSPARQQLVRAVLGRRPAVRAAAAGRPDGVRHADVERPPHGTLHVRPPTPGAHGAGSRSGRLARTVRSDWLRPRSGVGGGLRARAPVCPRDFLRFPGRCRQPRPHQALVDPGRCDPDKPGR